MIILIVKLWSNSTLFLKRFLHLTCQVWCILQHGPETLWSLEVSEEITASPLVSFQNKHTKWVTINLKVAPLTVSHSISVDEPSQINANSPYGTTTWCLGESWGFLSGILKLTIIQWRISSPATVDGRIIVPRSNILPTHHKFVEAKSEEEKSFSSSGLSCTYGWWLVIKEGPRSYSSTFPSSDLLGMSHSRAPSALILSSLEKGCKNSILRSS